MAKKLTHDALVQLVDNILHPQGKDLTSEQLNRQLLLFCINCPDPSAAMDIVIDTPPPVTAEELVQKAFACPFREVANVPEAELPATHPLRHMILEK
jgi:hypothetical protein